MFELAVALSEFHTPTDQALDSARAIGAEQLYVAALQEPGAAAIRISELSDPQADDLAARVAARGQSIVEIDSATFKEVHLCELEVRTMTAHPQFAHDLDKLERAMRVAQRLGIPAVTCFGFAWPGEYGAGAKSTGPMRWATRGGLISNTDLDKLEKAFALVVELAERYHVDLRVMQMAWNYTNTSGNFRRIAERLGSPRRLRLKWCPADSLNSGELDVATAGLRHVLPYVDAIHMKDLTVDDGPSNRFHYELIGEGQVDYAAMLTELHRVGRHPLLAVASHVGGGTPDATDPVKQAQWLGHNYDTVGSLAREATGT